MTNYGKIKHMSIEQMADLLWTITNCCYEYGREGGGCNDCPLNNRPCCSSTDFIDWLESEAETE